MAWLCTIISFRWSIRHCFNKRLCEYSWRFIWSLCWSWRWWNYQIRTWFDFLFSFVIYFIYLNFLKLKSALKVSLNWPDESGFRVIRNRIPIISQRSVFFSNIFSSYNWSPLHQRWPIPTNSIYWRRNKQVWCHHLPLIMAKISKNQIIMDNQVQWPQYNNNLLSILHLELLQHIRRQGEQLHLNLQTLNLIPHLLHLNYNNNNNPNHHHHWVFNPVLLLQSHKTNLLLLLKINLLQIHFLLKQIFPTKMHLILIHSLQLLPRSVINLLLQIHHLHKILFLCLYYNLFLLNLYNNRFNLNLQTKYHNKIIIYPV